MTAIIPITDFDPSLLPEEARDPGSDAFKRAVSDLFAEDFSALGGSAEIVIDDHAIRVSWVPGATMPDPVSAAVGVLRRGQLEHGVRMLRFIESAFPEDPNLHFNLGAALSDLGELDEAIGHLEKATTIAPDHTDARVALGIAWSRKGDLENAVAALEEAVRRDASNAYALRSLGGALLKRNLAEADIGRAVELLQEATEAMPEDPSMWLGLGQSFEAQNDTAKATAAYKKAISLKPPDGMAEFLETALTRISNALLRTKDSQGGETLRLDAVEYCRGALGEFGKMRPEEVQAVGTEIALLGAQGIDPHDATKTYPIKSLGDREFTAMRALCYMFVAWKQFRPDVDVGFDVSREYEAAKGMG